MVFLFNWGADSNSGYEVWMDRFFIRRLVVCFGWEAGE